ncbi:MAG: bi-domain-containing oxidoreductase [Sedimentisphaerales bacterium]|nr:bi-domain-containing oxidoreductase [Sedimentisphaerales bacterium]
MEQITQKLISGEIVIQELPWPIVGPGMVLVRNHYSLISAGTEGSTVKTARKSLIGKAKERPQQVKQVINTFKQQGPIQTYRAVMKKLDAYSPLGYSSAGQVIEVGAEIADIKVGDMVACAGAGYANHAEIVCIPGNLCVKLEDEADLKKASYNTLGAIALQGIRQADLRLGESCLVIGLGLLGQLTCLMLRASGIKTFGLDINENTVDTAKKHCCDDAWLSKLPSLSLNVENQTNGLGVDAVIITAGSSSLEPINCAGELVRKKGRVVVVGAVPTGFDRDPYWYKKELELRMSCSYGPGRYDSEYEEKGMDYPPAYVRWTEKRNMQAFQELVYSGKINLDYLTTHEFSLEDASKAYNMIVSHSEPFLGIVLKYDIQKPIKRQKIEIKNAAKEAKVNVAFVGAGSYAQQNLLPNIQLNKSDVSCVGIMSNSGTTSKRVAEKFGFQFCTSESSEIFDNKTINTVFVTTRHDSHAQYVRQAITAGKHVFVEKPLCLTIEDLDGIQQLYNDSKHNRQLMVGFNRRFAPLTVELKKHLDGGPISMLYRVNAGKIPKDHWIQDPKTGGGRIIGEVCHFIDLMTWFCNSVPKQVHAVAIPDPSGLNDTVCINLQFANGSIGTINYFANGSKEMPKEYIEVYSGGIVGTIHDFKMMELYSKGKPNRKKGFVQDKGQKDMVHAFLERIKEGGLPLIPVEEIFSVMRATFAVKESLSTRQAIVL